MTTKSTIVGLASTAGSVAATLTDWEQWIRVAAGLAGLVLVVLTIVYKVLDHRKGKRDDE